MTHITEEAWGPWIEHDGKGLPVPRGTLVVVRVGSGAIYGPYGAGRGSLSHLEGFRLSDDPCEMWKSGWHWSYSENEVPPEDHVLAYRIRKDGFQILQDILNELPADCDNNPVSEQARPGARVEESAARTPAYAYPPLHLATHTAVRRGRVKAGQSSLTNPGASASGAFRGV